MNIKDENNSDTIWGDNARSDADSVKQEKVGSLTFKVVDAPSQKPSTEKSGSNVGSSKETTRGVKKPVARAKAPFQIGYTHMDWLKVTLTHPDLAGLKGQSNKRLISLSEVKQHNTEDSMWTVFKGCVYNVTPYTKAVGKDCTALFNKYHAWVNAEFMLEKCLVGILEDSQK
ncbi:putative cytochrome-b5 reductase [Helianthus annuus]|uniref:Cytochrome-b5 reductase n=1 Tax=Helianthus annuus TaxID=4232 RepID=A0A251VR09_HELAN|nr:putative cytochrome-b5 reductase [Helianthus annuus]